MSLARPLFLLHVTYRTLITKSVVHTTYQDERTHTWQPQRVQSSGVNCDPISSLSLLILWGCLVSAEGTNDDRQTPPGASLFDKWTPCYLWVLWYASVAECYQTPQSMGGLWENVKGHPPPLQNDYKWCIVGIFVSLCDCFVSFYRLFVSLYGNILSLFVHFVSLCGCFVSLCSNFVCLCSWFSSFCVCFACFCMAL